MYHSEGLQPSPRALMFRDDGVSFTTLSRSASSMEFLGYACEQNIYEPAVMQWDAAQKKARWFGAYNTYGELLDAGFDDTHIEKNRVQVNPDMLLGKVCQQCHGDKDAETYVPESVHPVWVPYRGLWPGTAGSMVYSKIYYIEQTETNTAGPRATQVKNAERALVSRTLQTPGFLRHVTRDAEPTSPTTPEVNLAQATGKTNMRRIASQLIRVFKDFPLSDQRALLQEIMSIQNWRGGNQNYDEHIKSLGSALGEICARLGKCQSGAEDFAEFVSGDANDFLALGGQHGAYLDAAEQRTQKALNALKTALKPHPDIPFSLTDDEIQTIQAEVRSLTSRRVLYSGDSRQSVAIGYLAKVFGLDWRAWTTPPSYWHLALDFSTGVYDALKPFFSTLQRYLDRLPTC